MTKPSYTRSIDNVLQPAAFLRERQSWRRESKNYLDEIDIQIGSGLVDLTVNFGVADLEAHRVLKEAYGEARLYTIYQRAGSIIDGRDRWWRRSDPDGPKAVAAAIRDHVLPFIDSMHSTEALCAFLEKPAFKWRDIHARFYRAILLGRLGRVEDALDSLKDPTRRGREAEPDKLARQILKSSLD